MARFRRRGAAGPVSGKRGLAREKLLERHGLLIGRETLRGLMRDAGLWHTRAARRKAVQQPRARRQYFGELIQIDGSDITGLKIVARTARC
jgi:hypothetical protein